MGKLKKWLHWRGITIKDLVFGGVTLGFLTTSLFFLIYAAIASCQL